MTYFSWKNTIVTNITFKVFSGSISTFLHVPNITIILQSEKIVKNALNRNEYDEYL